MKIFYTTDKDELLKHIGVTEDDFWAFSPLEDWDYSFVIDGPLDNEKEYFFDKFLDGCYENEFFEINGKSVGITYHS